MDNLSSSVKTEPHLRECAHCGLQNEFGGRAVTKGSKWFCCRGCATAYEWITACGLGRFYSIRDAEETHKGKPIQSRGSSFDFFDHPDFIQDYVQKEEDFYQVTFRLEGLHCSACVWLIEKLPKILPGVQMAQANFSLSEVQIQYDPKLVNLSKIASSLRHLGYEPYPLGIGFTQKDQQVNESKKDLIIKLAVAGFCTGNAMMISVSHYEGLFSGMAENFSRFFGWMSFLVSVPAVVYSGRVFYRGALAAIKTKTPHMDLPISIAIVFAFLASVVNLLINRSEVYFDSVTMLIFLLLLGRWLQNFSLEKVRQEVEKAWSALPRAATLKSGTQVPVTSIKEGDEFRVGVGEVIPVDGVVSQGSSRVDRAILTGESGTFETKTGSSVLAGAVNQSKPILVRASTSGKSSKIDRIAEKIRGIHSKDSQVLQFVDRWSGYFTGSVLLVAVLTLFFSWVFFGFLEATDRVVALLVVACPCALGLATPLALAWSLSRAAKTGVLIRGADALERAHQITEIYFDKTGTLTSGDLSVGRAYGLSQIPSSVLQRVRDIEAGISHPVAVVVSNYLFEMGLVKNDLAAHSIEFCHFPGSGISFQEKGVWYRVGKLDWLLGENCQFNSELKNHKVRDSTKGSIYFSVNDQIVALLELEDSIRPEAQKVVDLLKKRFRVGVLSGDDPQIVEKFCRDLGFSPQYCHGGMKPEEKSAFIQNLQKEGKKVLYVGDGVNDAPALVEAHLGIAVRGGAALSLEAARVYLSSGSLEKLLLFLEGVTKGRRLILRNLFFSLMYNLAGVMGAVFGFVSPLVAALLMPASSLTVFFLTKVGAPFGHSGKR